MWSIDSATKNSTNKFVIPTTGQITLVKPASVQVDSYINDTITAVSNIDVQAGDVVYFQMQNWGTEPTEVQLEYMGTTDTIVVPVREKDADMGTIEETNMTPAETINLFANPGMGGNMGGAVGGGLGAGLVGGLLGTALFGRRGLGLDGGEGVAPVTLAGVESVVNNSAIMQSLGDIKAAIPLAESQVQLALAGAQMDLNNSIGQSTTTISGVVRNGTDLVMGNLNMQTQMNQKGFSDNQATILASGNANLLATKDASILAERNSWALNQAITNDGDKTRALIQSIDKSNDSRTITTLANEVSELRNEGRLRNVEGNITISNNNTATAVAQQQQAQQQAQQITTLLAHVGALYDQNQRIQQGVLNIGSGTVSGNSQTAANTRVS